MTAPLVTLTQNDWSLHRKGPIDQSRHNEKVKEAIKGNLPCDHRRGSHHHLGRQTDRQGAHPLARAAALSLRPQPGEAGRPGQGGSKQGDVVGQESGGDAPGTGKGAGDQPGVDYYEAELTVDEMAALVFEDLGLPFLEPREHQQIEDEVVRFTDVRRQGILANLDKRRTIMQNLRRNARAGHSGFGGLTNDDLRFKVWEPTIQDENNAVVIAMRDVSGSMGEFEKYITRSFYFWMVRFLRTKYQSVEIVFITHHTEAKEVDEPTFFNLGESGGTRVSSAYQLALEIIKERYDPQRWNVYAFHFSDGDNWGDVDNERCVTLVQELLGLANAFGYGEIRSRSYAPMSTLRATFARLQDPRFISVTISSKEDVYPALRTFFSTREPAARAG